MNRMMDPDHEKKFRILLGLGNKEPLPEEVRELYFSEIMQNAPKLSMNTVNNSLLTTIAMLSKFGSNGQVVVKDLPVVERPPRHTMVNSEDMIPQRINSVTGRPKRQPSEWNITISKAHKYGIGIHGKKKAEIEQLVSKYEAEMEQSNA